MPEPNDRDDELALSATDGEPLSLEALQRIARAVAKGREEGRRDVLRYVQVQAESPDWRGEVRVALRYVSEEIRKGFNLEAQDG